MTKFMNPIFILLALFIPCVTLAQAPESECLYVDIEGAFKPSDLLFTSKDIEERRLYFANQFDDSIELYVDDKLIKTDVYRTNSHRGTTGKFVKFSYAKNRQLRVKMSLYSLKDGTKKEISFVIRKSILKRYKLFFIFQLKCGFTFRYANYMSLDE